MGNSPKTSRLVKGTGGSCGASSQPHAALSLGSPGPHVVRTPAQGRAVLGVGAAAAGAPRTAPARESCGGQGEGGPLVTPLGQVP